LVSTTLTLNLAKIYLTTFYTKGLFGALFYDKYIMTTQYYTPTIIAQDTNESDQIQPLIEWNINGAVNPDNPISTKDSLYTISGLWMEKYLSNTRELICTGLNIPLTEQPIVGITLFLDIHRKSRIEDLHIQLVDSTGYIGDNLASPVDPVQSNMYTGDNSPWLPLLENKTTYGGVDNTWGATLSNEQIADLAFGVAISFRSNQVYPHRDIVVVNQISVGVTYG
jgi:hypothetical protein